MFFKDWEWRGDNGSGAVGHNRRGPLLGALTPKL